jgi:predicted small secreted protein
MLIKKRAVSAVVFVLALMFLCGCETVKGAGCGVTTGVTGAAKGVSKDSSNFWQAVLRADDWFRKNLW